MTIASPNIDIRKDIRYERWRRQFATAARVSCLIAKAIDDLSFEPELDPRTTGTLPSDTASRAIPKTLVLITRKDLLKITKQHIRRLVHYGLDRLFQQSFERDYENGSDFLHALMARTFHDLLATPATEESARQTLINRRLAIIDPQKLGSASLRRIDYLLNRELKYLRRGAAFMAAAHEGLYNRKNLNEAIASARQSLNDPVHAFHPFAIPLRLPPPRLDFEKQTAKRHSQHLG